MHDLVEIDERHFPGQLLEHSHAWMKLGRGQGESIHIFKETSNTELKSCNTANILLSPRKTIPDWLSSVPIAIQSHKGA